MPDDETYNSDAQDTQSEPAPARKPFNFKEWYRTHGKTLNLSRQERYQNDPEYKARVLAGNRSVREKKRAALLEARKNSGGLEATRVEKSWKTYPMVLMVEGEEVEVQGFTIGAAAKILGWSVQALRLWERKGLLPPTPYRYNGRDRLYPWIIIEEYSEILKDKSERKEKRQADDQKKNPRNLSVTRRIVKFSKGLPKEVTLFRIGVLAKAAFKTVVTLEQWEAAGLLPETPFRAVGNPGYRLYTMRMIRAVKRALHKRGWEIRGSSAKDGFFEEIFEEWKREGVIGARILEQKAPKQKVAKSKSSKKRSTPES